MYTIRMFTNNALVKLKQYVTISGVLRILLACFAMVLYCYLFNGRIEWLWQNSIITFITNFVASSCVANYILYKLNGDPYIEMPHSVDFEDAYNWRNFMKERKIRLAIAKQPIIECAYKCIVISAYLLFLTYSKPDITSLPLNVVIFTEIKNKCNYASVRIHFIMHNSKYAQNIIVFWKPIFKKISFFNFFKKK